MLPDTGKSYPCADDFPSYQDFLETNVVSRDLGFCGPVHGLVCLYDKASANPIALFNPSLREIKILPPSPSPSPFCLRSVGLGYDDVKRDYKVVQLTFDGSQQITVVEVYSRKENTWRVLGVHVGRLVIREPILQRLPPSCRSGGGGAAVAHWSASTNWWRRQDRVIVSFDMRSEALEALKTPRFEQSVQIIEIFAKEDSFIMFVTTDPDPELMRSEGVIIWEYKRGWSKVGRLGPFDDEVVWPVALWRSDGLVLKMQSRDGKCKLGFYDCCRQEIIKCFELPVNDDQFLEYRGSFVSP